MRKPVLRYAAGSVAALATCLILVEWIVPALIRDAYAGESLGLLNDLIAGQAQHSVGRYLDVWRGIARPATVALALLLLLGGLRYLPERVRSRLVRPIAGEGELDAASVLLVGVCFGIVAGIGEVAFRAGRHYLNGYVADHYYPELLWMGPLSAALAFAAAAASAGAICALVRVRCRPRLFAFPLAFVATWSVLQSEGVGLHRISELFLALGVAAVAGRVAGGRPERFRRIVRRSSAVLLPLLIVGTGVGLTGSLLTRAEKEADIASSDRPNVLLLILDTVRARNTSLHGYERPTTPTLERWGAEGVIFDHAISSAPSSLPSHATIFTGRFNRQLGTGMRARLADEPTTLAEVLSRNGYRTAGFVANFAYATRASGLEQGFQRYEDFEIGLPLLLTSSWLAERISAVARNITGFPPSPTQKDGRVLREDFVDWLDTVGREPFFAFLNFFDAHSPYRSPLQFMTRFGPPATGRQVPGNPHSYEGVINQYDGAIRYIDAQIRHIRDELERRGMLSNTLVIVTSDHGEQLGEHGLLQHGGSLYLSTLHVPLFITLPGELPAGVHVAETVSLRDLPRTVLDLVGLADEERLPGYSLRSLVQDGGAPHSPAFSEESRLDWFPDSRPASRGDMQSLVEWPFHYIRYGDGEEELFEVVSDPTEAFDLFERPEAASRGRGMRARVDSILASP